MQSDYPHFSKLTVRLCDPAGTWAVNKPGIYSADVNNLEYLITANSGLTTAPTNELAVPRILGAYVAALISLDISLFSYKKNNGPSWISPSPAMARCCTDAQLRVVLKKLWVGMGKICFF